MKLVIPRSDNARTFPCISPNLLGALHWLKLMSEFTAKERKRGATVESTLVAVRYHVPYPAGVAETIFGCDIYIEGGLDYCSVRGSRISRKYSPTR